MRYRVNYFDVSLECDDDQARDRPDERDERNHVAVEEITVDDAPSSAEIAARKLNGVTRYEKTAGKRVERQLIHNQNVGSSFPSLLVRCKHEEDGQVSQHSEGDEDEDTDLKSLCGVRRGSCGRCDIVGKVPS